MQPLPIQHLAQTLCCRAATAKKAAAWWSMTSSSLSDPSTCAERTLNVTGPQRNALIRLWEQGATGSHLYGEIFHAGVFTRPYIHSLMYMRCHKHIASFSVHCTAPYACTHTHHFTLLPAGGPDHPAQLVNPRVDSLVGEDCCRDLPYHRRQCRDWSGMSRSSCISPQGTDTNLSNK